MGLLKSALAIVTYDVLRFLSVISSASLCCSRSVSSVLDACSVNALESCIARSLGDIAVG